MLLNYDKNEAEIASGINVCFLHFSPLNMIFGVYIEKRVLDNPLAITFQPLEHDFKGLIN